MPQPRQRSPLYLLDAFGWSEWNVWALQEGGLSEWCPACHGSGFVVDRMCGWREAAAEVLEKYGATRCTRSTGCLNPPRPCRHVCPACKGARLRKPDVVRSEDFGDAESLDAALVMFPGLDVAFEKRSDMDARAL